MAAVDTDEAVLAVLLRQLQLPAFAATFRAEDVRGRQEDWNLLRYLRRLCESELEERRQRKVARLRRASGLPAEKTLETLELKRLPTRVARSITTLAQGDFVAQCENVLAFGHPGTGKTHALAAIGHELVGRGYAVLFVPTFKLVQRLLVAKRDLVLDAELKRLDRFDVVILDDIGYVQQAQDEMEVLFTFLAERYERRSVMLTSNLVFSQWSKIFKDPMTTAAAIDRIVHHAFILEFGGTSYRTQQAASRKPSVEAPPTGRTAEESHAP